MILEWLPLKEFYKLPVMWKKNLEGFLIFVKVVAKEKLGTFSWATLYMVKLVSSGSDLRNKYKDFLLEGS